MEVGDRYSSKRVRKEKRRKRVTKPLRDDLEVPGFMDALMLVDQVQRMLEAIPSRERVVLQALLLQGFTRAEIGSLMGVSESTVDRHRQDALDRLRDLFSGS